jgi:hypothetical protein
LFSAPICCTISALKYSAFYCGDLSGKHGGMPEISCSLDHISPRQGPQQSHAQKKVGIISAGTVKSPSNLGNVHLYGAENKGLYIKYSAI